MENKIVGILIGAFVAILLGVVLVSVVADQTEKITQLNGVSNESISLTTVRGVDSEINESKANISLAYSNIGSRAWRQANSYCYITNSLVKNASGTTLTSGTDYQLNTVTGQIHFLSTAAVNQSFASNLTSINYQYCPDNVVGESWARTITDLIAGFFVLGILGIGIFLVIKLTKDELE
jgi:hypothetical protein